MHENTTENECHQAKERVQAYEDVSGKGATGTTMPIYLKCGHGSDHLNQVRRSRPQRVLLFAGLPLAEGVRPTDLVLSLIGRLRLEPRERSTSLAFAETYAEAYHLR